MTSRDDCNTSCASSRVLLAETVRVRRNPCKTQNRNPMTSRDDCNTSCASSRVLLAETVRVRRNPCKSDVLDMSARARPVDMS
eukprot:CAMPEP_0175946902 /NCGR_PEP_ID=MMETSP0108-20121206/27584_1 /TAXON_ID=195067 ORGANISM="Goniomonas pacifica, Strain CCMP1869" /NCGR_SAMPLE_ID=MMETSP0108 /ASSEMBLY_ACC=CAM_ASM_000204 /LENGTH=82 /DNA_ID=CAMNT_0017272465 /DNA_START=49 /DNA_END=297 /DNA_ORIENTATION=+